MFQNGTYGTTEGLHTGEVSIKGLIYLMNEGLCTRNCHKANQQKEGAQKVTFIKVAQITLNEFQNKLQIIFGADIWHFTPKLPKLPFVGYLQKSNLCFSAKKTHNMYII